MALIARRSWRYGSFDSCDPLQLQEVLPWNEPLHDACASSTTGARARKEASAVPTSRAAPPLKGPGVQLKPGFGAVGLGPRRGGLVLSSVIVTFCAEPDAVSSMVMILLDDNRDQHGDTL